MKVLCLSQRDETFGTTCLLTLDRVFAAKWAAEHPNGSVKEEPASEHDAETLAALIEELP